MSYQAMFVTPQGIRVPALTNDTDYLISDEVVGYDERFKCKVDGCNNQQYQPRTAKNGHNFRQNRFRNYCGYCFKHWYERRT